MVNRAVARYGEQQSGAAGTDRELLARHGQMLDRLARRLAARTGHAVQPEDLWSAGALGLLEAARRFDAARDVRFETFAEHRIRGAMLDELRRMDHLPRRLRADTAKVEAARARLSQASGREAEPHEIAEAVGLPLEDVAELLHLLQPPLRAEDTVLHAGAAAADEALAAAEARQAVADAIAALPERLRILLALHYDEELTYREIAKILEVSEPRVCQLHSDAMKRIREALAARRT
jgi:RNA polymerase sigma factor for flagellar operon FliA